MSASTLTAILHAVVGLAGIAALSILGAMGTITGSDALGGISAVLGVLLGVGATSLGAGLTQSSPTTPAPVGQPAVLAPQPVVPPAPLA